MKVDTKAWGWNLRCKWFRRLKCKLFHRGEHACWDQLTLDPCSKEGYWNSFRGDQCPGPECWYCNECGRSWSVPNLRKFPSDSELGRLAGEYYWPRRKLILFGAELRDTVETLRKNRVGREPQGV